MKKMLLILFSLILLFNIAGCDSNNEKQNNNQQEEKQEEKQNNNQQEEKQEEKQNNNQQEEKQEENVSNSQQSNSNNNAYIDDEIIDIEDEENTPIKEERVTVEKVINCEGCVYAYFSGEGEKAKKLGDTLSKDEYTNDINNIRTTGNKQRHNFFGLVLSGNTISKAYSCVLKDNKIYCIQGSTNGAYHTNNIGVLNQIFTASQCKTLSDGNNYWCTDGQYNGNSKTSGYAALHYETSCTIYGADSNTGKLICH